jgi:hypothetical protein
VAERVRLWQRFLRKASEGLSREEQRGLFGELWVLLRLSDSIGAAAFEGWTGPTGDAQDFLVGADSIEVKTTAQKLPLSIQITSELQLDDTNVESLHLWVLALDVRSGMGETLPAIVSRARSVASSSGVRAIFEDLLVQCGYHDVHSHRYTSGYSLREDSIHRVLQDFPRITERDCPVGIGSVRYELQLGAIEKFRVDEAQLLDLIRADRG